MSFSIYYTVDKMDLNVRKNVHPDTELDQFTENVLFHYVFSHFSIMLACNYRYILLLFYNFQDLLITFSMS